jgi:hypothetical protein
MIVGIDHEALRGEVIRKPAISAAMFGKAMRDDDDTLGRGGWFGPAQSE